VSWLFEKKRIVIISLLKRKVGQSLNLGEYLDPLDRIIFLRHRQENREQRLIVIVDTSAF
jgi:hypothetical protein